MAKQIVDQAYYKDGFDPAVSKTHQWRTAENSAKYMLELIKPQHKILDVGCGPGTITYDLGSYVPQGEVIGIEPTKEVIEEAISKNPDEVKNVKFEVGSVYNLPYEDNLFDIVHTHQVVIHLEDRVAALKEMKRVTKPGGFVCCREGDLESISVYPLEYHQPICDYFTRKGVQTSTHTACGRMLKALALEAGFSSKDIRSTASNWCISDDDDRVWFSNMFIERLKNSHQFRQGTREEKESIKKEYIDPWMAWSADERGWLLLVSGEIICQKN